MDIETALKNILNPVLTENNSNKIQFVETNVDIVLSQLVNLYEAIANRTIARGDPIKLFLNCIACLIICERNNINHTARMNLLRYASDKYLDELGYTGGVTRLAATKAKTTLKIILSKSSESATIIPKGIRVTKGNNIFFALTETVTIPPNELTIEATAECTLAGIIGNGFAIGEINKIVDRLPFTATIYNITETEGGADMEADSEYRERIRLAPESYSVAGPDGAYTFWAKSASPLIADVSVVSPKPGDVSIYAILQNGKIPEDEILEDILTICNDRTKRPLTDHVFALAPDVINFDVDLTYYISNTNIAEAEQIQEKVNIAIDEWILWTKAKIGRDINPSELIRRIVQVGGKRVEIRQPVFTRIYNGETKADGSGIEAVQIAIASENKTIIFGGLEDD